MNFYRTLTLDHTQVPSNQSNFPVLFQGEFAYLATVANAGKVQNVNGYDIYFSSDSLGLSVLPFERVHWSATTGACEFWVQVGTLSSSISTVIYLQYGNPSISTDQSNTSGTWDSDYVAVYHFGDGTTLSVTDSTSNANNGTNHGCTAVNDGIGGTGSGGGGAIGLSSGSSQYVDLGNGLSLTSLTGPITIEAWAKVTSGGPSFQIMCSNLDASSVNGWFFAVGISGADGFFYLYNGSASGPGANGRAVTLTNWQQYVGSFSGTQIFFYTDATNDATSSTTQGAGVNSNHAFIGTYGGATDYFNGAIDELRISKIHRIADWITTGFNLMDNPAAFVTIGSEESSTLPLILLTDTFFEWRNKDNMMIDHVSELIANVDVVSLTDPTRLGSLLIWDGYLFTNQITHGDGILSPDGTITLTASETTNGSIYFRCNRGKIS